MKKFMLVLLAIVFIVMPALAADIKIYDNTTKWSFPYKAESKRFEDILSKLNAIKLNLTYLEVINLIGEPDVIDDFDGQFFGLSPKEDSFTLANRQYVKYRVIWYLEKRGSGSNLNDVWLAVYLGRDKNIVIKVLTNKIASGDDSF